jgi:bacterial/archaeal transporter family protein
MVTILLVITTILWGTAPIIEKTGLAKVDPLTGLTIRSSVVTVGLLVITFIMGRGKALMSVDGKGFFLFALSGLTAGLLAMWTYYSALKIGATSKVVPIAACYPLFTALLSALILREGVTLPRLAGTALIVSGIWLVK